MPTALAPPPTVPASAGGLGGLQPALVLKIGDSGAHSARTMMLDDLSALIAEEALTLQRNPQNLHRKRDLLLPRLLSGQVALSGKET